MKIENLLIQAFYMCIPFLLSCSKSENLSVSPKEIYKEHVLSVISNDVRIFDGKVIQATPIEKTYWVAFDCSSKFWADYLVANKLSKSEGNFPISVSGGENSILDTGYEGYIDNQYELYRQPDTKSYLVHFYVRKMNENVLRIVYRKAEY